MSGWRGLWAGLGSESRTCGAAPDRVGRLVGSAERAGVDGYEADAFGIGGDFFFAVYLVEITVEPKDAAGLQDADPGLGSFWVGVEDFIWEFPEEDATVAEFSWPFHG